MQEVLENKLVKMVPKLRFREFDDLWVEKQLSNIATFQKGKGISKADIDENGRLECIRYGELYTTYAELIVNVVSKTNIPESDLILSLYNDVIIPASGESNIDIATASCVLKSGVAYSGDLNIIRTKLNGLFLAYYLSNKKKKDIASLAQGVSVVHLYSSQLKTLKLNLPSLPEQKKIAVFLSGVDKKIEQLSRKKELLEQYKKGVMQKLFSQEIRFKPDQTEASDDDNGNDFPEWEEKRLGEISERVSVGLATSVTEYYTHKSVDSVPIIRNLNIKNGYFDDSDMLYLKPSFSSLHPNKRVRKGDVITVHTGSNVGLTCVVPDKYDMAQTFTTLIVTPKPKRLFNEYLNQLLSSDYGNYQALRLVVGGGKGNLNTNDFKLYPVALPNYNEQQKIANYLSAIDEKIEKVANQSTQIQTFKKGLLQQMFV